MYDVAVFFGAGAGVRIKNGYIWNNVVIEDNCVIDQAIIADNVVIKAGVILLPGTIVGRGVVLGPNVLIHKGTRAALEERSASADIFGGSDTESEGEDMTSSIGPGARTIQPNMGAEGRGHIWPPRKGGRISTWGWCLCLLFSPA